MDASAILTILNWAQKKGLMVAGARQEYAELRERLRADREALAMAKERIQAHNRGSTHYEGCAADHPDCAALRLIEALLESNDDQS